MKKSKKNKSDKFLEFLNSEDFQKSFDVGAFQKRLSSIICTSRKEKELTQGDLRKKSETTQRIISEIENGSYNMGVDLLYRIFKSLEKQLIVDGRDLITGDYINNRISNKKFGFYISSVIGSSDADFISDDKKDDCSFCAVTVDSLSLSK